jgi:ferredoxin
MSRLEIDWTRCDGHGLCATLLPELITLDEWGFPVIDGATGPDDRAVRRAVLGCPALALRLSVVGERQG